MNIGYIYVVQWSTFPKEILYPTEEKEEDPKCYKKMWSPSKEKNLHVHGCEKGDSWDVEYLQQGDMWRSHEGFLD